MIWLMDKPKSQWTRSAFRTTSKSDMFVNNHCEVFNSSIRKFRHLPIITMLIKEIHKGLMTRIQRRRDKMLSREGIYCTKALARLHKAVARSGGVASQWSGGPRYLVTTTSDGFESIVELCTCRFTVIS